MPGFERAYGHTATVSETEHTILPRHWNFSRKNMIPEIGINLDSDMVKGL